MSRPDIFKYHDFRVFLVDWLAYRKASQSGFSLRLLAKQAGLAVGYLPMVLSGKRPLTAKALAKLETFLGLKPSEQSFLENLVVLGTSDSHDARLAALEKMRRFTAYQKHNRNESEVYEYMTHWYYVVIREMAALEGFKLDAQWIHSRLKGSVPLQAVKDAIDFLTQNHYLEVKSDGAVAPPEKALTCSGGVYRVALAKFHREILGLAGDSIDHTPSDQRNIQGHTFALGKDDYEKAQAIVEEAITQVRKLGLGEKKGDSIYHMEIALFPMTKRRVAV